MKTYTPEQIQAAAKAAGYTLRHVDLGVCRFTAEQTNMPWEPWHIDSDAFNLMVDAGIVALPMEESSRSLAFAVGNVAMDIVVYWADHDGDKHAATRHAIMEAAIAKGSQEKL